MERTTFFRAAEDLDLMAPLSDLSDDDLTPCDPCAARSMALVAKKRGRSRAGNAGNGPGLPSGYVKIATERDPL